MPFLHDKRFLRFLLVDTIVLLGVMGVFASVDHAFVPKRSVLSERVFRTPEPGEVVTTAPGPSTGRSLDQAPAVLEVGNDTLVDLTRYRGKTAKVTVYTVKKGENFWTIRTDHGIDLQTLIGANPSLPFAASIDQKINILSALGTLHTVEKGETSSSIAALYRVEEAKLKEENGVSWFSGLREGDVLFLPGTKPLRMTAQWNKYFSQRGVFGIPFAGWGKGWTSGFGVRKDPLTGDVKKHKGMDFKARYGEQVFAAAGGRVVFASFSEGYGNLVQIGHGNGYKTYYGHLSEIKVKQGQKVRRGQLIGKVGATGRVTGPHLHFEIRRNGVPIDPLPLI